LERIGDYGESIARQVLLVSKLSAQPSYEKFVELCNLAVHMLRDAVQSYAAQDRSLAERTMAIEERGNILRNAIYAELNDLVLTGNLPPDGLNPLMTVARRLERVTDQAKNLCEEVLYMCTGEFMRHKGVEGFRILFLDNTNGGASQMAEAIANSLKQPRFYFSSAGISPQPIDPRVKEFIQSKGLSSTGLQSKSLEQVPGWEHYQVIVCLEPKLQEAIPAHPGKTIYFNWPMKDLSTSDYDGVWTYLEAHIKELADALAQEPQPLSKS
jgi:protein-tyrosine-phosphatase